MTEREKMLSGALYASEDPELAAACIRARTLCGRLNQTPPEEREAQEEIIRRLFASVGRTAQSILSSGVTMAATSPLGTIFMSTTIVSSWTAHPSPLGTTYSLPPTAASIPQATPGRPYPECRTGVRQAHHRGQ